MSAGNSEGPKPGILDHHDPGGRGVVYGAQISGSRLVQYLFNFLCVRHILHICNLLYKECTFAAGAERVVICQTASRLCFALL